MITCKCIHGTAARVGTPGFTLAEAAATIRIRQDGHVLSYYNRLVRPGRETGPVSKGAMGRGLY